MKMLNFSLRDILATPFCLSLMAAALATSPVPALAGPASAPPPKSADLKGDLLESPFEACKGVVIVSRAGYDKHKKEWQAWEKECNAKVQLGVEAGVSKIDPLKEGPEYLDFASKVAEQSLKNLEKSRKYAECSKKCFAGAKSCEASLSDDGKAISCADRKKEIHDGLLVQTRQVRAALALAGDDMTLADVKINNVLTVKTDDRINKKLEDFELGLPNPVGRAAMTDREIRHARGKIERDRAKLEEEFKQLVASGKAKNDLYGAWMSRKLMENIDGYKESYKRLVYEKAPVFAVIDKPSKFDDRGDPVWDDAAISKAFGKLVENADKTHAKIGEDLKRGKLEFDRGNLEAFSRWLYSAAPGTTPQHELLYYMTLTNQVEEVLARDKNKCGVATSMMERLGGKGWQNMGAAFVATGGVMAGVGKKAAAGAAETASALTGTQAVFLTGMGMTAPYLTESFKKYSEVREEAATKSGLGGEKEGSGIRTVADIEAADTNAALNALFSVATPGIGAATTAGVNATRRYFANAALRGQLSDHGVPASLSKDMVRLAGSKDKAVREASKARIDDFLKKTEDAERKLLGEQAGNPDFSRAVEAFAKKGADEVTPLQELATAANRLKSREERRDLYNRAVSLVEKYNPSRVATPEDRKQAIRAVVELAHFGVKDEKAAAEIVSNWGGESLKGLSYVIKKARTNLKLDVGGDVEGARKVAMLETLSDARFGKPLAKLNKSEVDEVTQMCVCATYCPRGAGRAGIDPATGLMVAANSCVVARR